MGRVSATSSDVTAAPRASRRRALPQRRATRQSSPKIRARVRLPAVGNEAGPDVYAGHLTAHRVPRRQLRLAHKQAGVSLGASTASRLAFDLRLRVEPRGRSEKVCPLVPTGDHHAHQVAAACVGRSSRPRRCSGVVSQCPQDRRGADRWDLPRRLRSTVGHAAGPTSTWQSCMRTMRLDQVSCPAGLGHWALATARPVPWSSAAAN
jgi:hypothetical protein